MAKALVWLVVSIMAGIAICWVPALWPIAPLLTFCMFLDDQGDADVVFDAEIEDDDV
jgi:hypothetical protein